MADPFFQLSGQPTRVDESRAFCKLLKDPSQNEIRDTEYWPNLLAPPKKPRLQRVSNKNFSNVSLSKTEIKNFDFQNCKFDMCLFIGSTFTNCRFTECTFTRCNMHRITLNNVFVHPKIFRKCIIGDEYSNIGIHLFHELLKNSRSQAQPDHADEAQYMFRRWQRFLDRNRMNEISFRKEPYRAAHIWLRIRARWAFEFFLGSGVRFRNLVGSTALVILLLTTVHWLFRNELGLAGPGSSMKSIPDALYFTTITLTTLGYGDITPTTTLGRLLVSIEALFGFVLLAIIASTVFRRFSS